MTLYDMPNMSNGIDDALIGTVSTVPVFTPMLLVFVFMIVLIGGSLSQRRKVGTTDMPMWVTIASISTMMVAMPMTLVAGLIQIEVLSIVVVITIFSGVWLFFDRNRNEI